MFSKYARIPLWFLAAGSLFLMSCGRSTVEAETIQMPSMKEVSKSAWEKLSAQKIYFGHQSVGGDILDGVQRVMPNEPSLKLNIVDTHDPEKLNGPIWAHSNIGENGDPFSKINGFKANLQKGIGGKADIAFFKFCFWDIRSHTDVEKVFNEYKRTVSELKSAYPQLKIVHFTVPLVEYPNGIYPKIRRMLGLPIGFDQDNIKRNELSWLIRKEYAGREPIVDIALYESTLPGGERAVFINGGEKYDYLAAANTDDGGHLNLGARLRAAEQALITLAQVAEKAP